MDIRYLKGIGEKRAQMLAKLNIHTAEDLLCFYPRDYVDYSAPYSVSQAPYEVKCVVRATVYEVGAPTRVRSGKKLTRITAGDDTGTLALSYFNNPYISSKLNSGETYLFFGKVGGSFLHREMVNPVILTEHQAQQTPFVPIYPQTQGVNSAFLSKCVQNALEHLEMDEPLPESLLTKYRLCTKQEAVVKIHFPKNRADIHAARRRLIYEELLTLQLGLLMMRKKGKALTGSRMKPVALTPLWASLPFSPTGAQQRAAAEIMEDLQKPQPMNRLLQGDVGSGKTLVAAAAIYCAVKNGYQAALMAPTEILAVQHAGSLERMLSPFGISVVLLTGSMKQSAKKLALNAISEQSAHLVVGTHAVLSEKVQFANLGLVITDEQHRFGVRQRTLLAGKARHPHTLVMSATPIPRTLGLLMFGDLDISILDELPPGRIPIKTYAVTGKKRADLFGFLSRQLDAGRQAYIVCPLIEESESELLAAQTYCEEIARPLLPGRRVGLMHGRLKAAEKAAVMEQFQKGELDVLVSTTVIEVGVDVPNANCIVIENAERYGLSALHQLRGRVGRGGGEAYCILVSDHVSESVKKRLSFLCHTTDGFEIAKFDLETRGPGDFFGSRQHGLPSLRIADLMADSRILYTAQQDALEICANDPTLSQPCHQGLSRLINHLFSADTALN